MDETFDLIFSRYLAAFSNKIQQLGLPSRNIIAYLGRNEIIALQNDAHFFSYGSINIESNCIEYMGCEIIRVEKENFFNFSIKEF